MEVVPPEPGEGRWFAYAPGRRAPRPWQREGWSPGRAHALDASIPVILMPEYAIEVPLWNHNWEDLGLPAALLDDLADWQEAFDAHFDPGSGWGNGPAALAAKQAWAKRADELVARLREALPEGMSLEVDLWPLHER